MTLESAWSETWHLVAVSSSFELHPTDTVARAIPIAATPAGADDARERDCRKDLFHQAALLLQQGAKFVQSTVGGFESLPIDGVLPKKASSKAYMHCDTSSRSVPATHYAQYWRLVLPFVSRMRWLRSSCTSKKVQVDDRPLKRPDS